MLFISATINLFSILQLYRQICCSCQPPPEKPVFQVLCIGLTGSGKTSLIYAMSKDKLEKEEPTIGKFF